MVQGGELLDLLLGERLGTVASDDRYAAEQEYYALKFSRRHNGGDEGEDDDQVASAFTYPFGSVSSPTCACGGFCIASTAALTELAYLPKPDDIEEIWRRLRMATPTKTTSWKMTCTMKHHYAYSSYFSHIPLTTCLMNWTLAGLDRVSEAIGRQERLRHRSSNSSDRLNGRHGAADKNSLSILEVGSGLGLFARLLADSAVRREGSAVCTFIKATCTDLFNPKEAYGFAESSGVYGSVVPMEGVRAVRELGSEHDVLLLVWPLLAEEYTWQSVDEFLKILRAQGRVGAVLYVGELEESADGEGVKFFSILENRDLLKPVIDKKLLPGGWGIRCAAALSLYLFDGSGMLDDDKHYKAELPSNGGDRTS